MVLFFLAVAACEGSQEAGGAPPPGGPPGMGRWEARAPMPDPGRMYVGVAAAGGKLFVVGGGVAPTDEARVILSYDPAADRWTTLDPLPKPFPMPNVAGVGGKLYLLGGLAIADVLEYDVAQNRWMARKPVPVAMGRGAAAVGVSGTKVIVAGGITPGQSANMLNTGIRVRETFAYDTARDEWESLPDMPLPRGYAMGAVLGNQFWVAGGSTDFVRTDQVDALDLTTRKWVDKKPLPQTLSSAGAAVVKGRIYVAGGIATSTGMITPETIALDATSETWTAVAPMTTPRFAMGAAALDDRLYVPTGAALVRPPNAFGPVPALEVFVP